MDPVTHAVAARMAASIGRAPLPPAAAFLSVVAGLAPDLDAIMMPVGWDLYLRVHEAGTHSLAGGAVLAAAVAGVWRLFTAVEYRALLLTALIAVLTHIALDVVSGATIRLGWPIVPWRTAIGLVAMADPLLAAPISLGLLVALLSRWTIKRIAPVTFVVVAAILTLKVASRQLAKAEYDTAPDRSAASSEMQAQWSSMTRWFVYDRTANRLRLWSVDGWRRSTALVLDRERADAGHMIAGERDLSTVRNFLRGHHLSVRVSRRAGTVTTVLWSDLRFCFPADPRAGPPSGSRQRPTDEPIACGVWFGGELDAGGRIVRQFVTIGDFVQQR